MIEHSLKRLAYNLNWTPGVDRGLLHGIPLGIKDIIDVTGFATRAGTTWRAEACQQSAPLVQNLLEAGAIVLGNRHDAIRWI